MAKNDWICWLDADDEYFSNYLETYNDYINRYPDYKLFNSGMLVKDREFINETRYESGWRIVPPLFLQEKKVGMESFDKGRIGSGSFVFRKDLLWFFPEDVHSPYGDINSFPAKLVDKFSEFKEICFQNNEKQWLPLGNPWGDDYSYFWYLTRKNKSKMINALLYVAYIRK
jgi:glycosyltransferase involved in cell wall biosynthesis